MVDSSMGFLKPQISLRLQAIEFDQEKVFDPIDNELNKEENENVSAKPECSSIREENRDKENELLRPLSAISFSKIREQF